MTKLGSSFYDKIQEGLVVDENYNSSRTENGALGYRTSGKYLVDMNYKVSSYRNMSDKDILDDWINSYTSNPELSLKWLFFARDARGGLGERRLFRVITRWLSESHPNLMTEEFLKLIPFYGRFDDLISLISSNSESSVKSQVIKIIKDQLTQDRINEANNLDTSISLLAKWMPSINASSQSTRNLGRKLAHSLGYSEKNYRKVLSSLRAKLKIVERDMSKNNWSNIEYRRVPSKANLIYNSAFMNHDYDRRSQYLENVANHQDSINSSTNYPYEIVNKYCAIDKQDQFYESMWLALADVPGLTDTIVVRDGSGSMGIEVAGSVSAKDIATSLTIYCAEHMTSPAYKNRFITFSRSPKYVDLSKCPTLYDKLIRCYSEVECSNTNIQRVLELILDTANHHKLSQSELPKNILIISDMEFDGATYEYHSDSYYSDSFRFMNIIRDKFLESGYELPRLIFWNVASRSGTIPMIENSNGLVLISGFSQNALNMINSGKLDPLDALVYVLDSARYNPVSQVVNKLFYKEKEGIRNEN
jgi:hypothetical protein